MLNIPTMSHGPWPLHRSPQPRGQVETQTHKQSFSPQDRRPLSPPGQEMSFLPPLSHPLLSDLRAGPSLSQTLPLLHFIPLSPPDLSWEAPSTRKLSLTCRPTGHLSDAPRHSGLVPWWPVVHFHPKVFPDWPQVSHSLQACRTVLAPTGARA